MSPGHVDSNATARRFPRVSGDEPDDHAAENRPDTFSPRERG